MLYVGRARDLRARLRSYFRTERQRPAVEAALGALERIEWRVLGSELEAALEELRLLRELRPPANARSTRPDRYVYLGAAAPARASRDAPGPYGPIKSRRRAELAARALGGRDGEPAATPCRALRAKLRRLSARAALRGRRAAARPHRRARGGRRGARRLERLRAPELCLLAPARRDGFRRAFFVAGGRVAAARTLLARRAGAGSSSRPALAAARARASPSLAAEDADELLLVGAVPAPPAARAAGRSPLERRGRIRRRAARDASASSQRASSRR